MKMILQSVLSAKVSWYADDQYQHCLGEKQIQNGILMYVGISKQDTLNWALSSQILRFAHKLAQLRLLEDVSWKINATLSQTQGKILLIPNFTLYGHYKSGAKIDFSQSGEYQRSHEIFDELRSALEQAGLEIQSGIFWGNMLVESINRGPINYHFEL